MIGFVVRRTVAMPTGPVPPHIGGYSPLPVLLPTLIDTRRRYFAVTDFALRYLPDARLLGSQFTDLTHCPRCQDTQCRTLCARTELDGRTPRFLAHLMLRLPTVPRADLITVTTLFQLL